MHANEWPRAVTTASIWVSIGFALGFGLFRMNFSGDAAMLLLLLTALLIGGGAIATALVWRAKTAGPDVDQRKS